MCTYKLFLALKVFPQYLEEYVKHVWNVTLSIWFTILIFCVFDFPYMEQMNRDFPFMISFLTYSCSMLLSGSLTKIDTWWILLIVIELMTIKWPDSFNYKNSCCFFYQRNKVNTYILSEVFPIIYFLDVVIKSQRKVVIG